MTAIERAAVTGTTTSTLSRASPRWRARGEMRARAAREDGFVPLEGDGAHLPHPHSDHVRMEMYGATVRCRARDVRLVLP